MKALIPILLNLYRGGAAIVFGVLLLFAPDKGRGSLLNLMGIFWLSIGFAILRRSKEDERYPGKHTALIAGLVAIRAGLLVVTRSFTRQWLGEEAIFFVLGTVILATGLVHIFGEYRLGRQTMDRLTGIHFLLALFEVLLGGLLILSPKINHPIVYWTATGWALVYGVMSLGTAIRGFLRNRQERKRTEASPHSSQENLR